MGWQQHRYAPAAGSLLCRLEDLPDGRCKELRFGPSDPTLPGDGALSLLLSRRGEQVRAYVNCCPHFSVPLNARPDQFVLAGNDRVMCAWHSAVFRLEDGHCVEGPAQGMGLDAVPVRVVEGLVLMGRADE
jgi:nitrite reductase/ring-hydroxylating ferredoxin subunit